MPRVSYCAFSFYSFHSFLKNHNLFQISGVGIFFAEVQLRPGGRWEGLFVELLSGILHLTSSSYLFALLFVMLRQNLLLLRFFFRSDEGKDGFFSLSGNCHKALLSGRVVVAFCFTAAS